MNMTPEAVDERTPPPSTTTDLLQDYQCIRHDSEALCAPLEIEDYGLQSMPDVSPSKWHLAHTSWFFETFVLKPYLSGYREYHPRYAHLFNSYYETVGTFHPRAQRGLLSRPTVAEIYTYRAHVNEHMSRLLGDLGHAQRADIVFRTRVGVNHEQQHQELLLTDIKYNFACNPLRPAYHSVALPDGREPGPVQWCGHDGGVVEIGHAGEGFAYDNETPRHKTYIVPFLLASRLVTNGEFIAFMEDAGYQQCRWWLSEGWKCVREQQWHAPLYWERGEEGGWWHMTLSGMLPVDIAAPVCHVSYYEADAYARWAGARLPGEAEWEVTARAQSMQGNLRDTGRLHPCAVQAPVGEHGAVAQCYGDVWEWTQSPYGPYPGFHPLAGSLGEYNAKFMCSQMVLRGGSCVTPADHLRASYRNFFYPADRWQFSGFRLAKDAI